MITLNKILQEFDPSFHIRRSLITDVPEATELVFSRLALNWETFDIWIQSPSAPAEEFNLNIRFTMQQARKKTLAPLIQLQLRSCGGQLGNDAERLVWWWKSAVHWKTMETSMGLSEKFGYSELRTGRWSSSPRKPWPTPQDKPIYIRKMLFEGLNAQTF